MDIVSSCERLLPLEHLRGIASPLQIRNRRQSPIYAPALKGLELEVHCESEKKIAGTWPVFVSVLACMGGEQDSLALINFGVNQALLTAIQKADQGLVKALRFCL
jgi:hypothetical protein